MNFEWDIQKEQKKYSEAWFGLFNSNPSVW